MGMRKQIQSTSTKCKQVNGVNYLAALGCLKLLGTDYRNLRRLAIKFKWRQYQLPTSPIVYYAEEDVMKVFNQALSIAGEKK